MVDRRAAPPGVRIARHGINLSSPWPAARRGRVQCNACASDAEALAAQNGQGDYDRTFWAATTRSTRPARTAGRMTVRDSPVHADGSRARPGAFPPRRLDLRGEGRRLANHRVQGPRLGSSPQPHRRRSLSPLPRHRGGRLEAVGAFVAPRECARQRLAVARSAYAPRRNVLGRTVSPRSPRTTPSTLQAPAPLPAKNSHANA